MNGDHRFFDRLEALSNIHLAKSGDYGDGDDPLANLRAAEAWGLPAYYSALIRIQDKVTRLQSWVRKGGDIGEHESIEDTCLDLASYAILLAILIQEEQDKGEQK